MQQFLGSFQWNSDCVGDAEHWVGNIPRLSLESLMHFIALISRHSSAVELKPSMPYICHYHFWTTINILKFKTVCWVAPQQIVATSIPLVAAVWTELSEGTYRSTGSVILTPPFHYLCRNACHASWWRRAVFWETGCWAACSSFCIKSNSDFFKPEASSVKWRPQGHIPHTLSDLLLQPGV